MRTAQIVVLGVALAAAAGAVVMFGSAGDPPPPAVEAAPAVRTTDVLVAAGEVPLGQTLRPNDMRWQSWPAELVPSGLITRDENPNALEDTIGSIARSSFLSGEPLRRDRLIKTDGSGFMSAILPSGMRAIAISIDTRGATSAGGFVLPNDRVDVIRTARDDDASRANSADVHVSETILHNIRVLAIGQNVQERNGERVVTGETATLEVTPGQAELLTQAQKTGQLTLALRSLADVRQPVEVREERDSGLTIVRYGISRQMPKR
jgi:pilus assembly protein CpaB